MRLLRAERDALEAALPGLDARLREIPFDDREGTAAPTIALYRDAGGSGLLIPAELGGSGVDPRGGARIQRAIASRSPSLALAATMHNFTIAALGEYRGVFAADIAELLRAVSGQRLLMASGIAEGRTGEGILRATMRGTRVAGGYRISGSKKPCSLSRSMDFLTATFLVEPEAAGAPARRAVALVPARSEGMTVARFWSSPVLAGAESDEVILRDVFAPDALVFFPECEDRLDQAEVAGMCWFEVLVTASYIGVASALAERVVEAGRGDAAERARLFVELEGAMAAVEGVAGALGSEPRGDALLARALCARYLVQDSIGRAAALAAELLGGAAFIGSSEVAYLLAAARALAFHPPSRPAMSEPLAAFVDGAELRVP